jgi:hypothetical protein
MNINGYPTPSVISLAQALRAAPVQAEDPQSEQFAQMMRALGEQSILSPGALTSNLLADALLQYGYDRRQQQLQTPATTSDGSDTPTPRPLQLSTGPDPSVPAPDVQGPRPPSPSTLRRPTDVLPVGQRL